MRLALIVLLSLASGTFLFADGPTTLVNIESWTLSQVISVGSFVFAAGVAWNQHRVHGNDISTLKRQVSGMDDHVLDLLQWRREVVQQLMSDFKDSLTRIEVELGVQRSKAVDRVAAQPRPNGEVWPR